MVLRHRGGSAAPFLRLLDARPATRRGWPVLADNGLDLLPGEVRGVEVRWEDVPVADRALRLDGWNNSSSAVAAVPLTTQ